MSPLPYVSYAHTSETLNALRLIQPFYLGPRIFNRTEYLDLVNPAEQAKVSYVLRLNNEILGEFRSCVDARVYIAAMLHDDGRNGYEIIEQRR